MLLKIYPKCWSGSLNISPIILKNEYNIKNKDEVIPGRKISPFFNAKKFIIKKRKNPSRIAS